MKKIFKKLIIYLNKFISTLNYKIIITRYDKKNNPILLNKFIWQAYYEKCDEFNLYKKAMKSSFSESSDNPYKQFRFYSLQNIFRNIINNQIDGDIVECGVWKGHSAYILASMLENNKSNKYFHIFDSFEGGLSEKSEEDDNKLRKLSEAEIKKESIIFSSSKIQVVQTLKNFEFIRYYEGWIPDKFHEIEDRKFCFIHIDVDLYKPTKDSLNFFYDKLEKGGAIVIDDYGLTQFPGSKLAVDEFLSNITYSFFYKVPFGSSFIIK